jgi:hypothetical protein
MAKCNKSKKGRSGKKNKRPNKNATAGQTESPSTLPNQQTQSKIMQLHQEIRDEIYAHLFGSIRGIRSHRVGSAGSGTTLAVLRTCRRMRDEIGASWLSQVVFHFEGLDAMLDKLARLPIALREKIRHLCVPGETVAITDDYDVHYRTAQILKLLPGLKLDRLTVLGAKEPEIRYETLNMLVRHSDGWK